jgi:hypothetical protein
LAQEALSALLKATDKELDLQGALWQMRLLLTLGDIKEVRERLPEFRAALETRVQKLKDKPDLAKKDLRLVLQTQQLEIHVPWFETLVAAADGDYVETEKALERLRQKVLGDRKRLEGEVVHLISDWTFAERTAHNNLASLLLQGFTFQRIFRGNIQNLFEKLRLETEFRTLQGILALEHGDIKEAGQQFRAAVLAGTDLHQYGERTIAARYLDLINKEKQGAKK